MNKAIIESQKARLLQDVDELQRGLQSKMEALDTLAKEIEQHKGALGYCNLLVKRCDEQLAELAKTDATVQPVTPPAQ